MLSVKAKYDHNANYTILNDDNYEDKPSSCIQRSESLRGHFVKMWNIITVDKLLSGAIIIVQ